MATYNYVDDTGLYYVLLKIKDELQAQYIDYDDTSTALGTNINTVQKAIEALDSAVDNKVDVVAGKGLSTNDFDNTYKQALDDLATTLADYALLSGATFTGAVTLPTVAAATNDNTAATTAYVTSAIATALGSITGITFDGPYTDYATLISTVTSPKEGVIYLVSNSSTAPNANDEYFYSSKTGGFELFGSTATNLSAYVQKTDLGAISTNDIKTQMKAYGYHIV